MFKIATLLKTFNGNVMARARDFENLWAVYEHWINTPNGPMMIYAGYCRLQDVFVFPDARRNSAWLDMNKGEIDIEIRIIATSSSKLDCYSMQLDIIHQHQPYCNKHGMMIGGGKAIITCVTTGVSYNTARECAKAEGITQSQLSNHLNGRAGFSIIKGKTYRRGP